MENNIFDLLGELVFQDTPETTMDSKEYLKNTKDLLCSLLNAHSKAFQTVLVKDADLIDPNMCDSCTGMSNNVKVGNDVIQCCQDDGDCYYKIFEAQEFADTFEEYFERIVELIQIDKLTSNGE